MSFLYEVLRDKPLALYMLDDTSPFQDYSGYGRVGAFVAGSTVKYPSFVAGTQWATVFTNTIYAAFAMPVFTQGQEDHPFTIGAWVHNASTGVSEQQILGNQNAYDGLLMNGTVFSFVVKFTTAPEARVSYDIQVSRAVHVVAVYTPTKISLFINGELVDELALTEEQQADTFAATTPSLYAGTSAGTQQIALSGLYAFGKALSGPDISRHYQAGANLPTAEDVVGTFGGIRYPVTLDRVDTFLDVTWGEDIAWDEEFMTNMTISEGRMMPQFSGDVSQPGQWITSVPMDGALGSTIYGVVLDWDGVGAVVQTSTNGTTWETAVRGTKTNNTNNLSSTGLLQIKVTFPGGITNDESYIRSLRLVGIDNATLPEVNGRVITMSGASPSIDYHQKESNFNWGTRLPATTNTITLSALNTSPATPVRTIEVWVRRTGVSPVLTAAGMGAGTYYENGVVGDGVLISGRWTLLHFVSDVDLTGTISINGVGQIGHIAVYEDALTEIQIAEINKAYANANYLSITDGSTITIPENNSTHKVYTHEWSILAAG